MVIFITGATSPIMRAFIEVLVANGHSVKGLTRKPDKTLYGKMQWIVGDLNDPDLDYSFLHGVNLIIHAAAVSNTMVDDHYKKGNTMVTKLLVDRAKSLNISAFVYISTIFAQENGDMYGQSKWDAEEIIRKGMEQHLIVRFSQLYGYGAHSRIDKLIQQMRNQTFIFYPTGGRSNFFPLHYSDAVSVLQNIPSLCPLKGETITVAGPRSYTYGDLLQHISSAMNKRIFLIPIPVLITKLVKRWLKMLRWPKVIFPTQIDRLFVQLPEFEHPVDTGSFRTINQFIEQLSKNKNR
ncbi:MAG TPA: NAD-dependent epimerase/dehydratase family protein [Saprospiraceae bacterium]|nr:NAD-dependent epimerase/dehydratase family protein [Saprospiraceae bacterium]